jgi:WD40 repeat protein
MKRSPHFAILTATVFLNACAALLAQPPRLPEGLIRRWDGSVEQGQSASSTYQGRVRSAYAPDGRVAAVGDARGRLDLWDTKTGKRLGLWREGPAVNNLAFAQDGDTLATGLHSGEVRFWEVPSGREGKVLRFEGKAGWSFAVSLLYSSDGKHLFVANYPNRVWLWEVATGREVWRGPIVTAAAFMPDRARLVVARGGPQLTFLDASTGRELSKVPLTTSRATSDFNTVEALAVSPDGARLAVVLHDGAVTLIDARDGKEMRRFVAVRPAEGKLAGLRFVGGNRRVVLTYSADGRLLLTGGDDGSVRLWETATGSEVLRRAGHEGPVSHLAFGPGGRTALTSAEDGHASLWDLRPTPLPKAPEKLWDELATEPRQAYQAVWALSEVEGAAALLRAKIAPVKPADPALVKKWIDDLNNDHFKARAAAARALAELGPLAGPAMEAALKQKPALETEHRLRKLLDALRRDPTPAELPRVRAVQALELAGTADARAVLRDWAGGAAGARLTDDARAALKRLLAHDHLRLVFPE